MPSRTNRSANRSERLARLACVARVSRRQKLASALIEFAEVARSPVGAARDLLAEAERLEDCGEPTRAAMVAWRCREDFPGSTPDADSLLHRLDALIPGVLFDDHLVWVSSRALAAGGSWLAAQRPGGLPTAWDSRVLASFARLLSVNRAGVLVDVGANTGSFALLGRVQPGLTVHAAEPNPGAVAMLRRHLQANDLEESTTVHECALSDAVGSGVLGVPPQTGLATLGSVTHLPDREDLIVERMSLDGLVERHHITRVDAIKIDTEGHELRVLQGAENVIARWRPFLLLEAVDTMMKRHGYGWHELSTFLNRHGYRVTAFGAEDVLAVPTPSVGR